MKERVAYGVKKFMDGVQRSRGLPIVNVLNFEALHTFLSLASDYKFAHLFIMIGCE